MFKTFANSCLYQATNPLENGPSMVEDKGPTEKPKVLMKYRTYGKDGRVVETSDAEDGQLEVRAISSWG